MTLTIPWSFGFWWRPVGVAMGGVPILALSIPDPATLATSVAFYGGLVGLGLGSVWIAWKRKIAPVQQEMAEKQAEFDRKAEIARADLQREIDRKRAEAEREQLAELAAARVKATALIAAAEAEAVRVVDEAKKGSVLEELERAKAERTVLTERLDDADARLDRADRRDEVQYNAILQMSRYVMAAHERESLVPSPAPRTEPL